MKKTMKKMIVMMMTMMINSSGHTDVSDGGDFISDADFLHLE